MQDDIARDKTVALMVSVGKKGAKLTTDLIKWAMKAYLEHRADPHGKLSVKQLVGKGDGVQSIEITDNNIKGFEKIAHKYGVDYSLKKDTNADPPKYILFFKAKETDAITHAFKEFTSGQLRTKEKPSIVKQLERNKEVIKSQVVDRMKVKNKEVER